MFGKFSRIQRAFAMLGALCSIAGWARADRVLLTPSAYNLPPGSTKLEVARRESHGGLTHYWVNVGLVGGIELEGARRETQKRQIDSLSLQYNILPDIGFTPAVSVGVRDVANRTDEGIAFYVAVAYRLPYMPPNTPHRRDVPVRRCPAREESRDPSWGAEVRTPYHILLSAEYDSRHGTRQSRGNRCPCCSCAFIALMEKPTTAPHWR
jgi:hypothetical protein